MVSYEVAGSRARSIRPTSMATGFISYIIKLNSLADIEIPFWPARWDRFACKGSWTNTYSLQFRNSILRLTSID